MSRKLLIAIFAVCVAACMGQVAAPKAGTPAQGGGAPGFSIQSEMLTYESVQSNSEAVACDIASYVLRQARPAESPTDKCNIGQSGKQIGVLILSSDTAIIANLQAWRAAMAVMDSLRLKADQYCPLGAKGAPAAAAKGVLDLTPYGQVLNMAQTSLGLFAKQEVSAGVTGTVEDRAYVDGIARQLRSFEIKVLAPEVYPPFTFAGADYSHSPLIKRVELLLEQRGCLIKHTENPGDAKVIVDGIDVFLASLFGVAPAPAAQNKSVVPSAGNPATPSSSVPSPNPPLMSILAADSLEQRLGIDVGTGRLPDDSIWQHVLAVKALESGGSLIHTGRLLWNEEEFTGGAVGTYSLFTIDGELECSGNVFNVVGPFKPHEIERHLEKPTIQPTRQTIFLRGGCSTAR